jgi:hypothetical protein
MHRTYRSQRVPCHDLANFYMGQHVEWSQHSGNYPCYYPAVVVRVGKRAVLVQIELKDDSTQHWVRVPYLTVPGQMEQEGRFMDRWLAIRYPKH